MRKLNIIGLTDLGFKFRNLTDLGFKLKSTPKRSTPTYYDLYSHPLLHSRAFTPHPTPIGTLLLRVMLLRLELVLSL